MRACIVFGSGYRGVPPSAVPLPTIFPERKIVNEALGINSLAIANGLANEIAKNHS